MAPTTPTIEPKIIVIGDTLKWDKSLGDFPAGDGWVLTYALRGPAVINITAGSTGDTHNVSETAATTAAYTAGDYVWASYATKGAERCQVATGTLEVKDNLAAITTKTYDGRSHVKTVLDNVEAVLEKRATQDQMSYSIAGRQLSRTPLADLLTLRSRFRAEYLAEVKAEKIKRGEDTGGRILTRFN